MAEELVPDRVDLPPRPPERRTSGAPLPGPLLAAILVPGLALAAAAGLQRWWEGPQSTGDAIARWLVLSCAFGLFAGLVAGLLVAQRSWSRALWTAWGVASPLLVAAAVLGGIWAARPLRDRVAALKKSRCLAAGRSICSSADFQSKCRLAAQPGADSAHLLGAPAWQQCGPDGCTRRYRYDGPWTPDDHAGPSSLLCSVVTDPRGAPVRFALAAGDEARPLAAIPLN